MGHGMHLRRHVRVATFAGLAWVALLAQAQTAPDAVRIAIDSRWGGFSPISPLSTQLAIEKHGEDYELSGSQSQGHGERQVKTVVPTQPVSAGKVARLVQALRAPMQPSLDPGVLQPVFDKLQQHIDVLMLDLVPETSPVQAKVDAWRETLRSPAVLAGAVTRGFDNSGHTDDYPGIKISVTFSDGSVREWSSDSQQYLMLPWQDATGARNYAVALPQAVAALMPAESTNKERLEQGPLDVTEWTYLLDNGLADDAGRFHTEAKFPDAFAALSGQFDVDKMTAVDEDGPHRKLDLELRLPDSPKNLTLSTRVDLRGKGLARSADIDRMRQQLALAPSSPVLLGRMKANPNVPFRISLWGWSQLDERTIEQFVSQMADLGKLAELKRDASLMRDAVMVEEGGSPTYWIVLPDHRTVLWKRYVSGSGGTDGHRCDGVPMHSEEPLPLTPSDLCYGKVYGADGQEQ